jgi:hypothetical protein
MHRLFKGRGVRIVASTIFTIAIGYLIYRYVSVDALASAFGRLDPRPAIFGLLAYVALTSVRALRFVVAGARLPFGAMFRITAVHSALLRVMPLRSGELAYAILLKRHGGGGFTEGIAALLMLRILDMAAILPLAAAILIAWVSGTGSWRSALAVVAAGIALGVFFFSLGPITHTVARRLDPEPHRGAVRRIGELARTLAKAYDLSLSRRLALLGLTFVGWALVLLWLHLTASAIDAVSTIEEGLVVGVSGVTGSALPVSLVGSFGPMEGGFAIGLAAIGHGHSDASAASIVISTLTFAANWTLGLPAWIAMAFARGKPTGEDAYPASAPHHGR